MQRAVLVGLSLVLVAACGDDAPDGAIDAPSSVPCEPPQPQCSETCGNNTIEFCFLPPIGNHCSMVNGRQEPCDGTAGPSCQEVGFYGGSLACSATCTVDGASCDACPPGATACATLPSFGFQFGAIATSGNYAAFVSTDAVLIVDGITEVGRFPFAWGRDIVGVPGGWLVSQESPARLVPLAPDGTFGTPQSAPTAFVTMANAADRVLVVFWQGDMLRAYVTDVAGVEVVPAFDLFPAIHRPAVTSDGAGFFVAADGRLAHVTAAGNVTVNTGYTLEANPGVPPGVTWNGTSGWHIAGGTLQRFDATGAPSGSPIVITLAADPFNFLADGAGLLAVQVVTDQGASTSRLSVVHIAADGTISAPVELGVGERAYHIARHGSDVGVAWTRPGHLQLARVTP